LVKEIILVIKPSSAEVYEFLKESNAIEREYSEQALECAHIAWGWAWYNKEHIKLEYILGIHKLLMIEIRPGIAGKLRNCTVTVGGRICRFISEAHLKDELEPILTVMRYQQEEELRECVAKDCHVRFEKVHPFLDGNGRTGRILYNIHRLMLGLPLHIIHEGKEQIEYYQWFK
jgi:fido (protein-threonine AMPylation protein)